MPYGVAPQRLPAAKGLGVTNPGPTLSHLADKRLPRLPAAEKLPPVTRSLVASPTGTGDGWPLPVRGFSELKAA